MKTKGLLIGTVIFIIFLTIAYFSYENLSKNYNTTSSEMSSKGNKPSAADFTVIDANGKNVKLSDFKGKPVVVNFWASWCPPCKSEMPHFNKLYEEYSPKGVVFLMVDMPDGQRETVDIAKKYISQNGYKFDIYFDVNGDAANKYSVDSIPRSLFINKDGTLQKSITGAINESTLKSNLDLILQD
jgi:cytochrome c biogenesis protein CcmG/thiol:disulfide interchange protein DsbE